MNDKLVSIIVPIYNVEEYLEDCINSLIAQTYKNIEIILIDDGSKDRSGKICDSYSKIDKRIRVIHKKNEGLSSARNKGLEESKGEYISFIDSDDKIDIDFIALLMEHIEKNKVDIAQCYFTNNDEEVGLDYRKNEVLNKREAIYRLNTNENVNFVIVCNKVYRKNVFKDIQFPVGKINEDAFTMYKVLWNAEKGIAILGKKQYFYRLRNNSIMRNRFSTKRYDAFEAYENQLEFFKEKKEKKLYYASVLIYQKILKNYWINTKEEIEENQTLYLQMIRGKSRKIYKYVINNTEIKFKDKLKYTVFNFSPQIYYFLIKKFDIIKTKLKR